MSYHKDRSEETSFRLPILRQRLIRSENEVACHSLNYDFSGRFLIIQ
jgi:hypothetical protein